MSGIPVRGRAKGSADAAFKLAKKRGAERDEFTRDYLVALYKDAATLGVDADVLVAQWSLETGDGTSTYWIRDGNPGGLAAFDDGSNWGLTFSPEKAARAHVTHMARYLGLSDVPVEWIATDARWQAVADAGYVGTVKTTDDLGKGRWATDPLYASKLRSRYVAYWGEPKKESTMGYTKHQFVGLSTPVYLPDDIPVEISIVPPSVKNVRSNQAFSGQTSYTQHETANFNEGANADMHKRWLHGGAGGSSVGFNFVLDDKKIIQLTPLNEVTWAAGTPEGNKFSYHTELCVNSDINHTRARRNAAALAGGILAAKGWDTSKLVQHNVWWGKDCPMLLRKKGLWPSFVNMAADFVAQARAAADGTTKPVLTVLAIGDTVETIDELNLRPVPGTGDQPLATLPVGTAGTVIGGPESVDGFTWWNIKGDFGNGWVAGDWLKKVVPDTGETTSPERPYPKPIVPPFWEDLHKDGTTYVRSGDILWFRSNDLYRVKTGGSKRLQLAIGTGESVGPDLKAGEQFRDAAKGQSALDGKAYVITPELTRVALDDLEFVIEE